MSEDNVALVIVTYNRSSLLKDTLESISALTVKPNKVIIVDNNSNDDTAELVSRFILTYSEQLKISYHNTGSNLGGAGGFEFGSKIAYEEGFEWIWLADDDIVFEPDCLKNLLEYKNKSDILQPLRLNEDGSCAEISGTEYRINNFLRLNPKKIKVVDVYNNDWESIEIKTIPFEGPLIHRRVFQKIGFPNSSFFIFYDDLDFALRASQSNFKILCIKNSIIIRKIRFIQNRALNSWKGYFMYRNFFKVQLDYAYKPVALLRILLIFIIVSVHSIFTGKFKTLPMLYHALKDSCNKNFPLNPRFKP